MGFNTRQKQPHGIAVRLLGGSVAPLASVFLVEPFHASFCRTNIQTSPCQTTRTMLRSSQGASIRSWCARRTGPSRLRQLHRGAALSQCTLHHQTLSAFLCMQAQQAAAQMRRPAPGMRGGACGAGATMPTHSHDVLCAQASNAPYADKAT